MTTIIKRDGTKNVFDKDYIEKAVNLARISAMETNSNLAKLVADTVDEKFNERDTVDIEEVVESVENELMIQNKKVARCYIEYRNKRDIARSKRTDIIKNVRGVIDQTSKEILMENANKNATIIPTMRDLVAGAISKEVARKFLLPNNIVKAHDKGEIHAHDLDYAPMFPMVNCCLVNVKEMFKGFKMGNAEIETPKSVGVASSVLSQIIAQVSSNNYGGTTIDNIDILLAPYVKMTHGKHLATAKKYNIANPEKYADELTKKECYDAIQASEYSQNTANTSNGQAPFVSFAFGRGTSKEAVMIQEAILLNRIKGIGKDHKTPNFPKLIFYKENGVNNQKSDPNYRIKRLAIECSAKRFYPDYISVEAIKEATGSVKGSMGCRSFLAPWTNPETGLEEHDGRCNLGVVSVNLPRIAIESKGNESRFWELMEERAQLCFETLMTRIDRLRGVKAKVSPILYMEGAFGVRLKADDEIMQLFENGRASISLGYLGVHETLIALYGKDAFHNPDIAAKGIEIVQFLRDKCDKWKEETKFGFGLYATPAENLCNRFCKLDREEFGIIEGVTDHEYYTNSFHLDVRQECTPYEKYDFEAPYTKISNGGFIQYAEYPDMQNNIDGLEMVIDYTHDHCPYVGINVPNDKCYVCGFEGDTSCTSKGFVCPDCGNTDTSKMSITRRVCGYLFDGANGANAGKTKEIDSRVKHM